MWSYFGSKTNIVKLYPAPKHDKIIEAFAGTARYSLRFFEKDVLLIDKYDVIINIWKWLQKCSVGDIHSLPHFLKVGTKVKDLGLDCIEAENLFGFITGMGNERPRNIVAQHKILNRQNQINYSLKRIAASLYKIRHWKIQQDDYMDIRNQRVTWFIDPPYQHGGQRYVFGSRFIDYNLLSTWVKQLKGQVIVCENEKADWMKFKPFTQHYGLKGLQKEVIWSNCKTAFDQEQLQIFK